MSIHLRDLHLTQFCDALAAVPPTAPTLCDGWDAHDLAVHVWVIKRDPLSWPGIVIPALEGATARRGERLRQRREYASLIAELRRLPGFIACMPLDWREGHRHAIGEYYIHTEDVRRANALPRITQTEETEDALWIRVRTAGRQLWTRGQETVLVTAPQRESFTLGPGVPTKHVHGLPSEVILWVYGRHDGADVEVGSVTS